MKKRFFVLLMSAILLLASCSMEATIPENSKTNSQYTENKDLYQQALAYFEGVGFDAMVSRNDLYSIQGSENISGLYIQNMSDMTVSPCDNDALRQIFAQTDVKLIDWIRRDDFKICAFDMCIPGKNFDYGIYYVSKDAPVYFGDPSIELLESGNGFTYEKKASYGAKFTYYTEKIEENFYYYEIL